MLVTQMAKLLSAMTMTIAFLMVLVVIVQFWREEVRISVQLTESHKLEIESVTAQRLLATDLGVFGPEKGLYNFTVVTCMMDIGRGSWKYQKRTYDEYLSYMRQVLRLDVNLVVHVDRKGQGLVEEMRRERESHTQIIVMDLKDLPYYKYKDRISEIMNTSDYQQDNELVKSHLGESYSPEFVIITLSKMFLINRTIWDNPFSTSYFIWLDGDYGHGKDVFPRNNIWIPKGLFEYPNQVTFIERSPGMKFYENKTERLHKMENSSLVGNFFAGGQEVLKEVSKMQQDLVEGWMEKGIVGDDQAADMFLYIKKPSSFRLVKGDLDDAFKLFNFN